MSAADIVILQKPSERKEKNEKDEEKKADKMHSNFDDFLAGWIGGAAGVIASHPLDTVKVRLQTCTSYKGTWDCVTKTLKHEGFTGFYKGMSFPLASVAAYNALVFGVYSNMTRLLCKWRYGDANHVPRYSDMCMAAMVTGGMSVSIGAPVDLIKIRLQTQTTPSLPSARVYSDKGTNHLTPKRHFMTSLRNVSVTNDTVTWPMAKTHYSGPIGCVSATYREHGVRGLYRGATAMLIRDIPGYVIYFVPYAILCATMTHDDEVTSAPALLLAGGLAGVLSWGAMHPVDTVKSRLQADGYSSNPKYRGVLHCTTASYQKYGASIFFRGMAVNSLRGFPQSAALFFGYEMSMRGIKKLRGRD